MGSNVESGQCVGQQVMPSDSHILIPGIRMCEINLVLHCLKLGADPRGTNLLGQTPLHLVFSFPMEDGPANSVRGLVQAGADLEAREQNGDTLLLSSVRREQFWLAALLLNLGANPNARDLAGTPLWT